MQAVMYLQCHACRTACFEPVSSLLTEAAGLHVLPHSFISSFACEMSVFDTSSEGAGNEMHRTLHGHAW